MNPDEAMQLMQRRTKELRNLDVLLHEEEKLGKQHYFPYHAHHARHVSDCITVPFGKLYPVETVNGLLEKKYLPGSN
ncbi:MAG: hypothetical protein V1725_05770 [archaeon]